MHGDEAGEGLFVVRTEEGRVLFDSCEARRFPDSDELIALISGLDLEASPSTATCG